MSELIDVKKIRKNRGLTQEALALTCGVSTRTVQNWEKGGVIPEVAKKLLSQMAMKHETDSPLTTPHRQQSVTVTKRHALNSLSMARTGSTMQVTTNADGTVTIQKIDTPDANAIPIMSVQANIDTGVTTPHDPEPIPATAEVIPIVPSEVAGEMGVDIRKYVEKNADELDSIDPTKLLKNPDLAEQVAGTSMLPTFAPGDVVFVKFLPDKAKIIDGKTYYFDLRTLPTMIRKVKFEDGERLRLIAKNPAFADIIINRCDILNIGRVIGMFRQTFGDQYDEIEEVRRKKDEQIDKFIDQNKEALSIIKNLIEKK